MGNLETARHCLDARNARNARAIASAVRISGRRIGSGSERISPMGRGSPDGATAPGRRLLADPRRTEGEFASRIVAEPDVTSSLG